MLERTILESAREIVSKYENSGQPSKVEGILIELDAEFNKKTEGISKEDEFVRVMHLSSLRTFYGTSVNKGATYRNLSDLEDAYNKELLRIEELSSKIL